MTDAADRTARLLALVIERSPRSVAELIAAAEAPEDDVRLALAALERHGLVEWDADRTQARFAPRGATATSRELAEPAMRRLADESGETVNLMVRSARRRRGRSRRSTAATCSASATGSAARCPTTAAPPGRSSSPSARGCRRAARTADRAHDRARRPARARAQTRCASAASRRSSTSWRWASPPSPPRSVTATATWSQRSRSPGRRPVSARRASASSAASRSSRPTRCRTRSRPGWRRARGCLGLQRARARRWRLMRRRVFVMANPNGVGEDFDDDRPDRRAFRRGHPPNAGAATPRLVDGLGEQRREVDHAHVAAAAAHAVVEHHGAERARDGQRLGAGLGRLAHALLVDRRRRAPPSTCARRRRRSRTCACSRRSISIGWPTAAASSRGCARTSLWRAR